jgi:hypothetical protein
LKTAFFAALAAIALFGCAGKEPAIGKLPPVDAANSGEVVVIRPSAFIGDEFSLYLNVNETTVAALGPRQHTRLRLPAGEHRIAIHCPNVLSGKLNERVTLQRIDAGQTVYFSVTPRGDCAAIESLSEAEGRRRLTGTSRVPL